MRLTSATAFMLAMAGPVLAAKCKPSYAANATSSASLASSTASIVPASSASPASVVSSVPAFSSASAPSTSAFSYFSANSTVSYLPANATSATPSSPSTATPSTPCGVNVDIAPDFTTDMRVWDVRTDTLSTVDAATCNAFATAPNSCLQYAFGNNGLPNENTGTLAFSHDVPTPRQDAGYSFNFYFRRTSATAVDGGIGCYVEGQNPYYDTNLVFEDMYWTPYNYRFSPTGATTRVHCQLYLYDSAEYEVTDFGSFYYCPDRGQSR